MIIHKEKARYKEKLKSIKLKQGSGLFKNDETTILYGEDKMEDRIVIGLLSPFMQISLQKTVLYIAKIEEIDTFTSNLIDLNTKDTAYLRFVRGWEEVELIKIERYEEGDDKGIEKLIDTSRNGMSKIAYTYLNYRIVYAKSKIKEKQHYYRGYYIDSIKNLCLVTKDGYIPLDKGNGVGNTIILTHNKRKLIKTVKYIHNHLYCIMGFIDKVYESEEAMLDDKSNIDLKLFIDNLQI